MQMIDELQEKGLLVEGEAGFELTEAGQSVRGVVKFRPREGFISKLLQRLNVTVSASPADLKKLL